MVRWRVAQSLYLRSTFGAGDRTRLRNRTTAQTQTLWPICGTSVRPQFRWQLICRRLTSTSWQFINIPRTLLQTTDGKFKKSKPHLFKLFPLWTIFCSLTTRLGNICNQRTFRTTIIDSIFWRTTKTLGLDDLLAKLIGGHFSFFTVDIKTLSSVANWP